MSGRSYEAEASVPRSEFFNENYFRAPALASLSEQIIRIYNLDPESLLEIGKGNGFVSDYLRGGGFDVTTFDINPDLKPDVVGNALYLDRHFEPGAFDYVLCCEVLEHMPFDDAMRVLPQIARVARRGALITIPRCQLIMFNLQARLSFRFKGYREFDFNLFRARKSRRISTSHHWELNHSEPTSMVNVRSEMEKHFVIEDSARSRLCPYHHFFILGKKEQ